ncbi:hypothetical protein, partial [Enterobacter cloacae]|uniref:hypothetical protein n=1 Tax=Enterobacter cloacae TaxID=550 RepID=UPI0039C05AEB
MMSLWDALRMNMMISYQELVRTFPNRPATRRVFYALRKGGVANGAPVWASASLITMTLCFPGA